MKLQCELCKEIVVADFAVVGAAIEVFCPACGKSFTATPTRGDAAPVEVARPAVRPGPADGAPAMRCPKCDDAQPPGEACRSCGLLVARFGDFARDRDAGVPPEVAAAWQRVEDAWADDAVHEVFLRTVAAALAFPWAALRYREALRLRPDDTAAAARLAQVARMAEATLMASSVRKPEAAAARPYRNVTTLLVALVALMLIGVGYAVIASQLRDDEPEPRASPPRPAPVKVKPKAKARPDVRP